MMNVETVLSSKASESDAGDSDVRQHSFSQPSSYYRRKSKQQGRHRISEDPPGVTVLPTPMEAAIDELVPQDVNVTINTPDNDPAMIIEDQQSAQSTLTGPPTVHFFNQPTDEDWERDHLDPYSDRILQSSRAGGLDPRTSSISYSKPPPNIVEHGHDDDSSTLPELPTQQDETLEAPENEGDVQEFLKRTYAPDASFYLDEDHIEEGEEDETSLQPLELPNENRRVRSSLDEDEYLRSSLDESVPKIEPNLPSTIGTQRKEAKKGDQRERQHKSKAPSRSFDPLDDVDDSDITPVMKSPRQSRIGKRAKKKRSNAPTPLHKDLSQSQTFAEASSVSRSPAFQSALPKKEEKKSKNDPSTKSRPPTPSKKSASETTHDQLPVLQSDSDTSSYQYYGKPRGRAKKQERNARSLGYDNESSEASSHFLRKSPYGTRKEEYRDARLLGYDDDTNTLSSLGLGRHRPFHDSHGSNDLEGSDSSHRGMLRYQVGMTFPRPSPDYNPRLQPQSFSQIPISANMTPEEWEMAQEQIKFLESELEKVSSLCLELTKAVDEDDPEVNGNWERVQHQVKYLEQELETVQGLCTMLTQTAKESTDAIEMLESDKAMLEMLIQKLEQALARSKDKVERQHKALEDFVPENESKCCNRCCEWISEPIVWFVSYLYRID